MHKWFKSYLPYIWQCVRINWNYLVDARCVGVWNSPRLRAVTFLFNIHIDSLSSVPKRCSLESYVDDLKTFLSFTLSHMERSLLNIEEDLHSVFEWCCNNGLLVNPEKTKMLVVGTRQLMNQLESPVNINFMGKNLIPVTEVKDFGMLLDPHLTYDKHIQALSLSCISKFLGFTMQICTKSEWGPTLTVLMFMLQYWREQMIGNCTYLQRNTRLTHSLS